MKHKNYKLQDYQHTTTDPQCCHNSAVSNSVMLSVSNNDVVPTNQGISLFCFYNVTNYIATLNVWSSDYTAAMQL